VGLQAQQATATDKGLESGSLRNDRQETFYHDSIWGTFVNKVFEGNLNVSELKTHGDVGLVSYNFLDGEMVMLDGVPCKIAEDGNVTIANGDELIVYANPAFFDEDASGPLSRVDR